MGSLILCAKISAAKTSRFFVYCHGLMPRNRAPALRMIPSGLFRWL
jgi:hypothetical protein